MQYRFNVELSTREVSLSGEATVTIDGPMEQAEQALRNALVTQFECLRISPRDDAPPPSEVEKPAGKAHELTLDEKVGTEEK